MADKIDAARRAINSGHTICLVGYDSSNSNTSDKDRKVEAFAFTDNKRCDSLWAFDPKDRKNKVFHLRRADVVKVVDPVMGDNGKAYSTVTPALIDRMRGLCRRADLILPNATEAALLLERELQTDAFDDASAQALADELLTLAPSAVVTGLALGKYIGCAGSGRPPMPWGMSPTRGPANLRPAPTTRWRSLRIFPLTPPL